MSSCSGTVPNTLPLPSKLRLAIEIAAAYLAVRLMLRREGLQRTVELLRRSGGSESPPENALSTARRLGRAVMRTLDVLPTDSRCLMRSLVLTRLLSRRGIDSRVVIAVRSGERFAAHAWVEHEGVPVLPTFEVFERLVAL